MPLHFQHGQGRTKAKVEVVVFRISTTISPRVFLAFSWLICATSSSVSKNLSSHSSYDVNQLSRVQASYVYIYVYTYIHVSSSPASSALSLHPFYLPSLDTAKIVESLERCTTKFKFIEGGRKL